MLELRNTGNTTFINLSNWQKKRFKVDLSYLLVCAGKRPAPFTENKILPSKFIQQTLRGLVFDKEKMVKNNTRLSELELNVEKVKSVEKDLVDGLNNKELSDIITKMSQTTKDLELDYKNKKEELKGAKKKSLKKISKDCINLMKEKQKSLNVLNSIKSVVKSDYLIQPEEPKILKSKIYKKLSENQKFGEERKISYMDALKRDELCLYDEKRKSLIKLKSCVAEERNIDIENMMNKKKHTEKRLIANAAKEQKKPLDSAIKEVEGELKVIRRQVEFAYKRKTKAEFEAIAREEQSKKNMLEGFKNKYAALSELASDTDIFYPVQRKTNVDVIGCVKAIYVKDKRLKSIKERMSLGLLKEREGLFKDLVRVEEVETSALGEKLSNSTKRFLKTKDKATGKKLSKVNYSSKNEKNALKKDYSKIFKGVDKNSTLKLMLSVRNSKRGQQKRVCSENASHDGKCFWGIRRRVMIYQSILNEKGRGNMLDLIEEEDALTLPERIEKKLNEMAAAKVSLLLL